MPYIGIDGSHFNEYVSGNYKDSMGNFGLLAFEHNVRTNILDTSEDLIAACSNPKYKLLVLTVPSRRDGTSLRDPYMCYTDDEIAAVKAFAENGGAVVVTGWSDLYENYSEYPAADHMSAQQNKLLEALGSTLRISDDASMDDEHNAGGSEGNKARLYLSNYNLENPLTAGIVYDPDHIYDGENNTYSQVFSQYGGTTIYAVDGDGQPTSTLPASVSPIVSGFSTTYSADKDNDGLGGASTPKYPVTQGNEGVKDCVLVAATETVAHENGKSSLVVVSGGAFMSNFEIKSTADGDNNAQLGYSNYNILENLIEIVNPPVITDIADVQAAPEGVAFSVEGVVTANASGFDQSTAFFDCTYIQDATGGINVFPVAGNYRVGQRVRVTGVTSSYGGERQLAVTGIKLLNATPETVTPRAVTTKQAATGEVLGQLIQVEGVVVSFAETEGAIQTIMVRDDTGYDARIFIDGYITTSKDAALKESLAVGNRITAVGLASYDNFFDGPPNRIRIRDRADIVCTSEQPGIPAGVSSASITIPPAGFATSLAGAGDEAFMREGVVLAGPDADGILTVAGTLAYKENFTGFSSQTSGNYLALRLLLPGYAEGTPTLTYSGNTLAVANGVTDGGNPYYDVIVRIDPSHPGFTITVDLDGGETAYTPMDYTFDLSGLTLEKAPDHGGSDGSGGGGGTSTPTPAPVTPNDVKESGDTVTVNLPAEGSKLNEAANKKVVEANKTKRVEIFGAGLKVVIPAGTLSEGADVNNMLVDPGTSGNVIEVTKADGTKFILPLAVVGGGSASYLANVEGTYRIINNTKSFPDVAAGNWAAEAISFVSSHEFFLGASDGSFQPEASMTRAMLVTVLARIDGGKTADGSAFTDVPGNAWYAGAVAWAAQNELVEGDGVRFNPDGTLTREQLCVILARYLDYAGLEMSGSGTATGFNDSGSVSPWAADAVAMALEKGLLTGKPGSLIDPQGTASRAEIAVILQRFVEGVLK